MTEIESASRPFTRPDRDRWAKEASCVEIADAVRNNGKIPDTRAIEAQVNGELAQCIARERERAVATPKRPTERRGRAAVEREAKRRGVKILEGPRRRRKRILEPRKTGRMLARELRVRALLRFNPAEQQWEHPGPAKEIIREQTFANLGKRDYAGLTQRQINRQLTRRLDDICDRSNLLFGADWRGLT